MKLENQLTEKPVQTVISDKGVIVDTEEKRLTDKLMELDTSDKEGLRSAIQRLITVGLFNQFYVSKGIGIGLLTDTISVQDAPLLMSKLEKPSELIKVLNALDGGGQGATLECFAQFVKRAAEEAQAGDTVTVAIRQTTEVAS